MDMDIIIAEYPVGPYKAYLKHATTIWVDEGLAMWKPQEFIARFIREGDGSFGPI